MDVRDHPAERLNGSFQVSFPLIGIASIRGFKDERGNNFLNILNILSSWVSGKRSAGTAFRQFGDRGFKKEKLPR